MAQLDAILKRADDNLPSSLDKLFALFADSDARSLELNPLSRLFRGDDTNADRLGDYLTVGPVIEALSALACPASMLQS